MKPAYIISSFLLLLIGITSCESVAQSPQVTPASSAEVANAGTLELTTVKFESETYDFGQAKEGEVVTHRYEFRNTGKHPLLVESAKPSCGCTLADYTKTAVAPGETGFVAAKFNTAGKTGVQSKTVSVVFANTDPKIVVLHLKGEVGPIAN